MPITAVPIVTRLQLRLTVGEDANLNPIYRTRSFSNIKPAVGNEDLYALAQEIGGLQVHPLSAVQRVNEFELEDVV
ncbi:MAG TPA: DUF1659 domain-containing protein [Candidatus Limnocylindrales bacterium]|nr:DUF1659 domain-containing protein [Candidatus Limnocylindrales bacterium]